MIRQKLFEKLINAIDLAAKNNALGQMNQGICEGLSIEKPRNIEFGDYAVNVSSLARFAKLPPIKIAEAIIPYIELNDVEIIPVTGFINFKLGKSWLNDGIKLILDKKNDFGRNNAGNAEKVQIEYVSANPTGPLHIGHGRWAAVGSALSKLMSFSGYDVEQEFYINDAGNQINNLGRSLWLRILQELGYGAKFPGTEEEGSKNYYPGDYLIDVAKDFLKDNKQKVEDLYKKNPDPLKPSVEVINEMSGFAKVRMLQQQKELLSEFKVDFDVWYSETSLHENGKVQDMLNKLKAMDEIYEKESAVWFKSSKYGDDQDRVLIKTDGSYTYLTADIAYHYDKLQRGYQRLINIWGADHHGYVPRMKAAIEALGHDPDCLEVLLGQLVNLIISGEQVRMGKRRKMLTLGDLIEEVGVDATRFWMIMRSIDTTLDFDVDLAKSCSDENPVHYVQYAHARASSILRIATLDRLNQETKETLPPYLTNEELESLFDKCNINNLDVLWNVDDEKAIESSKTLVVKLESFEDVVQISTKQRAPYQIARYAQELASDFHYFYTFSRVLNIEESLMKSRLSLVYATKQVLANALNILGVSAPESM